MKKPKEQKEKSPPLENREEDSEKLPPSEKGDTDKTLSIQEIEREHIDRLGKELSEYKDKYYRALAELENTKKRMQTEKHEMIAFAVKDLLVDFLAPLDQLENALTYTDNLSDELQNWAQGFKMILGQFKEVLANQGIIAFDSVDKSFDPHYHEAVDTQRVDHVAENTVLSERAKGYKMGDKVIRPAQVIVSKAVATPSEETEELQKEK